MRRWGACALASLVVACGGAPPPRDADAPPPAPPPAQADAPNALPAGIYALPPVDGAASDAELAPIGALAARARVFALGDSLTSSGGFVTAKARVTRLLVEEEGFRAVALPASRQDAARADAYVRTCTGDPAAALGGTLAAWGTADVRELLASLCAFNAAHADDAVRVVGIDVRAPLDDARALTSLLPAVAPDDAAALLTRIARCNVDQSESASSGAAPLLTEDFDACRAGLDAVDGWIDAHALELAARDTGGELTEIRVALTSLRAWQSQAFFASSDPARASDAHDVAVASVLELLLGGPLKGARVVLWGENHALLPHLDGVTDTSFLGTTTVGNALADDLGASYELCAIVGYDVTGLAPTGGIAQTVRPDGAAVETALHDLGRGQLLVDLEATGLDGFMPSARRYTAFAPMPDAIVPRAELRGILYLDRSPASSPLAP